ncbi:MAG TPA: efflux RND transporter periplasmic adaptor subunit [Candidatus Limnocylindrales bacterium]|jgi:RND family efflux transporter MFP subunit|nr:efflux RND transporter periplasmic adaptor subunit [Candidatus Limnocylindrales bacterium]
MSDLQESKAPAASAAPSGGGAGRGFLIGLVVLVLVAVVVAAGIIPRLKARAALKTETIDLAIPTVTVLHPKQGAPHQEIILPGNMQAFTDSPIYARTNGYLKKWYVDIGAHVKNGQLLAEIDTPEVDQQLQQARANLNTAQANYRLSQITANRYQDLKNTDSVAKQDVDNAVGDFQAKAAMVASAEYQVKYLEQLESFKEIYAPFDGVITARNTDIGALIAAGSSGGLGTQLFHISAIRTLRVYVNVPQQYSQNAKPGLSADITLQEFPGRRFKGTLVRTANSIDLNTRTLLVEVDVDNPSGELLPGAYASVHLKLPADVPSYIVPVSALVFRAQGLQVATVGPDNRARLVSITAGRDFGNEVEVVSGLTAEDNIIINPPDSIISGEQIRIAAGNKQGASQ